MPGALDARRGGCCKPSPTPLISWCAPGAVHRPTAFHTKLSRGSQVKKAVVICCALVASACGTAGVIPESPIIDANDKDTVWVTRAIRVVREDGSSFQRQGLFACYRKPVEKAGEPVCYLARFQTEDGGLVVDDLNFPSTFKVKKAKASNQPSGD